MTGIEPRPQRWEARVLPLCHRGPPNGMGSLADIIVSRGFFSKTSLLTSEFTVSLSPMSLILELSLAALAGFLILINSGICAHLFSRTDGGNCSLMAYGDCLRLLEIGIFTFCQVSNFYQFELRNTVFFLQKVTYFDKTCVVTLKNNSTNHELYRYSSHFENAIIQIRQNILKCGCLSSITSLIYCVFQDLPLYNIYHP